MSYTVSHFEIRARDRAAMEKFYTEVLGFIVTDRGLLTPAPAGARADLPVSHSPDEHHQIVLIPSDADALGQRHRPCRVPRRHSRRGSPGLREGARGCRTPCPSR